MPVSGKAQSDGNLMKEWSNKLRLKRWVGGLCLLVASIAASWWVLIPKEPSYQGKTLTEYQAKMMVIYHQNGSLQRIERMAIESGRPFLQPMGTNALPFLLRQIQTKDSKLEVWLRDVCDKRGWRLPFLNAESGWYNCNVAMLSFGAMREKAYPAVPELLKLARSNSDSRPYVLTALTLMERSDQELLGILLDLISNGSTDDRRLAVDCLLRLGKKAKPLAPEIRRAYAKEQSLGRTNNLHDMEIVLFRIE